ncbi:unnamed protein product, partial [marine sediment metagenome]
DIPARFDVFFAKIHQVIIKLSEGLEYYIELD